jgi:hypothetical protein
MQRVAVKNAIILNIIHNIFNHHDTEVAICSDDLNPHLGIELVWFMVVHATFSNISVISYPEKTTDLSQVTWSHNVVSPEWDANSQR